MAIYHLHVGVVSRKTGRSAVAAAAYRSADKLRSDYDKLTHDYCEKTNAVNAAAYRSGERLQNEQNSATHDYTRKRGVVHTEIILPENAPKEYTDRATLWNAVEKAEKRKDAQTARDIDMALPVELDRQEQITLVREYISENFVDKGMIADFAMHDKGDGNPHAHILLTTREVSIAGFGKKNRDWNKKAYLESWRESWSDACNERLKAKGLNERIDHRTLKAQGIDREPTIHIGVPAKHMERRGLSHIRAKENRRIIKQNEARQPENISKYMHELKERYFILDKEISALQNTDAEAQREIKALQFKAEEMLERAKYIKNMEKQATNKHVERSYGQARNYFKQKYNIEPEQAAAEAVRLETTAESKKHLQEKLQEKLTPLIDEKALTLLEYQRQKLLMEFNPDGQKIRNHLVLLEKESRVYRKLIKDNIAWLRCERVLDTVTERNFKELSKEMQPEHVDRLLRLRERDRSRAFQRGRF